MECYYCRNLPVSDLPHVENSGLPTLAHLIGTRLPDNLQDTSLSLSVFYLNKSLTCLLVHRANYRFITDNALYKFKFRLTFTNVLMLTVVPYRPSSIIGQKHVFGRHSSKWWLLWMKYVSICCCTEYTCGSLPPWAAPGQTFTFTVGGSRTNIHFHHGRLQVKHSLSPWAAPGQTFTFTKSGSRSNNKNFVSHSIITPVCTVGGRHINLTTANAGTWNPKNLGVLEIHFIFTVWQKNWLNSTVMLFFKCDQT